MSREFKVLFYFRTNTSTYIQDTDTAADNAIQTAIKTYGEILKLQLK